MSIESTILNRMVQLAISGQNGRAVCTESALEMLNKCGLDEVQEAKIASILGHVSSCNAIEATSAMKERILAVLSGKEEEPALQIVSLNKNREISFENFQKQGSLLDEHIQVIFFECHQKSDWNTFGVLGCLCKHYLLQAREYWSKFDLKIFCPQLTILDAKTQGIRVDDEPKISKLAIVKCYEKMVPYVENNEGVTLLTICKDTTLNQLIETAERNGITVVLEDEQEDEEQMLEELEDIPVKQTYVIMITNCFFQDCRDKIFIEQKQCVESHGCEVPTVREYCILFVSTYLCFKKYIPSSDGSARSSTHIVKEWGDSYPTVEWTGRNNLSIFHSRADFNSDEFSAGGKKKF